MGVKNLWDIVEPCKKTLPLHHLQNKRVCVDLSCWIVQLHNVNKSRIPIHNKFYLRGIFHRLRALIALNCSIIFVTDGSIPAIKLSTYRQRLNSGTEVSSAEINLHDTCSLRRNSGSQFSCMIKEAKILASALGITCLDGIEEAEAQCAILNSKSLCDGCFTSDSDAFLFGARTVYRDICLGEGGYVVCYEMTDIERKLGFGRKSLIALALLLGGDYSQGVRGLGPDSACQIVKSCGEDNVLQEIVKEGISFAEKTKVSKKQAGLKLLDPEFNVNGTDKHSEKQNQFVQVINAYLKPKCYSADSEPVYRALASLPFQRGKLQQVCSQFFGWTPEKTDEYILPKFAERDLRRFANLCLTSSELGVNPPLQKIPINCPVSGIVKPRKVQGRECFEVQWEGLDGLETSIVPADLVESACPEKIAEFVEKRELGKKKKNLRKPRREKSENKASMTEVELKLQALLLDIESDSNTAFISSFPLEATTSEDTTAVAVDDRKQKPPPRPQIDLDCHAASSFCDAGSSLVKNEIIDLLSPSPLPRVHMVSRCQVVSDQPIDVIDLSDSETEMSPGHAHNAREFRSFLASIRDD